MSKKVKWCVFWTVFLSMCGYALLFALDFRIYLAVLLLRISKNIETATWYQKKDKPS